MVVAARISVRTFDRVAEVTKHRPHRIWVLPGATASLLEMDVNFGRHYGKTRDQYVVCPDHCRQGFHPTYTLYKPNYVHGNWNTVPHGNYFDHPDVVQNGLDLGRRFRQRCEDHLEFEENRGKRFAEDAHSLLTPAKEKSPMCLINDIARYNKIEQRYVLLNEDGPAHKKVFLVSLKLGAETFSSSGQSIKRARHAAALEALKGTSYTKPQPKFTSVHPFTDGVNKSITPTVELNALAMKRGQTVLYEVIGGSKVMQPSDDFNVTYVEQKLTEEQRAEDKEQRLPVLSCSRYITRTPAFIVRASVGGDSFLGDGYSVKTARHSAAKKALSRLKLEDKPRSDAPSEGSRTGEAPSSPARGKSEISRVFEISYKRNFTTTFEMTQESGPAHMKTYFTICSCGPYKVTGEGKSKKASKIKSAEKMLEELDKLPPLPPSPASPVKVRPRYDRLKLIGRSVFKNNKASPDYASNINPISRLIQIQQAKGLAEPLFFLLEERGKNRDKEFCMQVTVGDKLCSSWAQSKKLAKREAAEKMLNLLGYSNTSDQMRFKTAEKRVTFCAATNQHAPNELKSEESEKHLDDVALEECLARHLQIS